MLRFKSVNVKGVDNCIIPNCIFVLLVFFRHYNRYFNENHPTVKGYDIYKYSGKELVEFMKRPDPACRYCTWVMKKETTQWDYSKREKSEWCEDV